MSRPLSAQTAPPAHAGGPAIWRSAAWRWSLMGGLALHLGLGAVWWSVRPEAPLMPTPMLVRLTSVAEQHAGRRADQAPAVRHDPAPQRLEVPKSARLTERPVVAKPANTPAAREVPQAPPVVPPNGTPPLVARTAPAPMPVPVVVPATTPPLPAMPTPTTNAVAKPVASATVNGATGAVAATVPATMPAATPAATAPTTAPTTAPAAADGRSNEPLEMDSSAVGYLVQPVLTFPDGEDLGEYGTVTLRVLVDEKGKAIEVKTLQSSGYARLDQHAVRVIRRARFVPKVHNGEPRKTWATVNLHFNAPRP